MKRRFVAAVAIVNALAVCGRASAGVVDSPLPAPFTQHVFTVPGIPDIAGFQAFFSCTNLNAGPVTIGVELFGSNSGVQNDVAATALTMGPGESRIFGTSSAVNLVVDSPLGASPIGTFSARILSTSKKIGCNAFLTEVSNAPPTSGWPLTIIAKTKQKAAN
jgi:hypothetical protein